METKHTLQGLVLAGGNSTRMGQDKAFLCYHDKPQYQYVYDLLEPVCESVCVSMNGNHNVAVPLLQDAAAFENAGPMSGLLTAFAHKQASWLVVAIDYPSFGTKALQELIAARNENALATVFFHPETGYFSPFLGIYEQAFASVLFAAFHQKERSLQHLLHQVEVQKVIPTDWDFIQSIDTPAAFLQWKQARGEYWAM